MATSIACQNPRLCKVENHWLGTGASAKCGARVGQIADRRAKKVVDLRVPSAVGASAGSMYGGSGGGRNIVLRPAREVSPMQWSQMHGDLLEEREAQFAAAKNESLSPAERTTANFNARGLQTAIEAMEMVDECDMVALQRELTAEIESGDHVEAKIAGIRLAAEMLA